MSRLENREYYKSEVVRMYTEEKKSMNKISKELKISDCSVKKLLTEAGVEMRHSGVNYNVTKNLFSKIDSHESAYWLGLLYADGNLKSKGFCISLDLKESDKYLVEEFSRYCLSGEVRVREHKQIKGEKTFYSYVCNFCDPTVHANLINLGCVPRKSLILKCPTREQVPDEFFFSFLRGYVDGDGYIQWSPETKHRSIQIIGTKDFFEGIIERCPIFGESVYLRQDGSAKSEKVHKMELYSKEHVFNILTKLYENNTICLKRKYETYLKAKEEMSQYKTF